MYTCIMYIANVMTHAMTHNVRQGTLPSRSATLFSSTSRSFVDCVETFPAMIATYYTSHLIIASIIVRDMNDHIKTDKKFEDLFEIYDYRTNLSQTKHHKYTFWLPNGIPIFKPDVTQQRNKRQEK